MGNGKQRGHSPKDHRRRGSQLTLTTEYRHRIMSACGDSDMTNEEQILQLLEAQQTELRKISSRLDGMESRSDKLEESAEITRDGVNTLIEWAEDVSNAIRFPLPKLK